MNIGQKPLLYRLVIRFLDAWTLYLILQIILILSGYHLHLHMDSVTMSDSHVPVSIKCERLAYSPFSSTRNTKTASMEDVSTGVFEKIKNIQEVKIKP